MSADNVEVVRRVYDWMASGEAERTFDVYDEDIEWDASGAEWLHELGFQHTYRGHSGVREAMRDWLEVWDTISYRPNELIDAGDSVLALVTLEARGRASGATVTYDHPQLWTFRDGRIVRMRVFDDRDQALRAAGLTEN